MLFRRAHIHDDLLGPAVTGRLRKTVEHLRKQSYSRPDRYSENHHITAVHTLLKISDSIHQTDLLSSSGIDRIGLYTDDFLCEALPLEIYRHRASY